MLNGGLRKVINIWADIGLYAAHFYETLHDFE